MINKVVDNPSPGLSPVVLLTGSLHLLVIFTFGLDSSMFIIARWIHLGNIPHYTVKYFVYIYQCYC